MKAKAVSALRSKRGLRPGVRDAEPQVVGLAPQTTKARRANTMKTYILRDPQTVEPQNPLRDDPAVTATWRRSSADPRHLRTAPFCSSAWTCITIPSP